MSRRDRKCNGDDQWAVSVATARGASHESDGTPCQDDSRWAVIGPDRALVAVVSDGAGSGRLSHYAAGIAVRTACYEIESAAEAGRPVDCDLLRCAARSAAAEIVRLYKLLRQEDSHDERKIAPGDVACTLVVVAVSDDRLRMLQVGDGAVVVDSECGLSCLSEAPEREYANETTFLVSRNALQRAYVRAIDATSIRSVAVMTDGVERISIRYGSQEPAPEFYGPLFEFGRQSQDRSQESRNESLSALLRQPSVSTGNADDKTIILAARKETQ